MDKLVVTLQRKMVLTNKKFGQYTENILFTYNDGTSDGWKNKWFKKNIPPHLRHEFIIWTFRPPLTQDQAMKYIMENPLPGNDSKDGITSDTVDHSTGHGGHDDVGGLSDTGGGISGDRYGNYEGGGPVIDNLSDKPGPKGDGPKKDGGDQ